MLYHSRFSTLRSLTLLTSILLASVVTLSSFGETAPENIPEPIKKLGNKSIGEYKQYLQNKAEEKFYACSNVRCAFSTGVYKKTNEQTAMIRCIQATKKTPSGKPETCQIVDHNGIPTIHGMRASDQTLIQADKEDKVRQQHDLLKNNPPGPDSSTGGYLKTNKDFPCRLTEIKRNPHNCAP